MKSYLNQFQLSNCIGGLNFLKSPVQHSNRMIDLRFLRVKRRVNPDDISIEPTSSDIEEITSKDLGDAEDKMTMGLPAYLDRGLHSTAVRKADDRSNRRQIPRLPKQVPFLLPYGFLKTKSSFPAV